MDFTELKNKENKREIMSLYNLKTETDFETFYNRYLDFVNDIIKYLEPYSKTLEFLRNKGYTKLLATISYILIDNFSYLFYGKSGSESFRNFSDKYIVPKIKSEVSSDEMWEDRNGILHNGNHLSFKVKQGKESALYHTIGNIKELKEFDVIQKVMLDSKPIDVYDLSKECVLAMKSVLHDTLMSGDLERFMSNFESIPYKPFQIQN